MHHAAHLVGFFFAEDTQGIRRGITHVNDERLAAFLRRGDVPAEALTLPLQVTLAAEIVQAGLADGHHVLGGGIGHQLFHLELLALAFVGVDPHRRGDIRVARGEFTHGVQVLRVDAHAQEMADARRTGRVEGVIEGALVATQIEAIEMAMGIDQHACHGIRPV